MVIIVGIVNWLYNGSKRICIQARLLIRGAGMNFFDLCYELFMRTSKYHDLGKDIQNYNKVINYMNTFYGVDRKEIEKFIIDVRMDNPVYSAIQQMVKVMVSNVPLKRLEELYPNELYNELCGELYNIVLKGAYDSIKLLNELTMEEELELSKRFANGDISIFMQYRSM